MLPAPQDTIPVVASNDICRNCDSALYILVFVSQHALVFPRALLLFWGMYLVLKNHFRPCYLQNVRVDLISEDLRNIELYLIRASLDPLSKLNVNGCITYLLTYLLTYGAEPFLRSCQLYSYSRTSRTLCNQKVHYRGSVVG
jgi:hypothetical protein